MRFLLMIMMTSLKERRLIIIFKMNLREIQNSFASAKIKRPVLSHLTMKLFISTSKTATKSTLTTWRNSPTSKIAPLAANTST